MFKFVHIADTHLDSAIKSNEKNQQLIINEIQKAFLASVDLCINEGCHAFLISGDLFDDERLSFKTELLLRDSFERLKKYGIQVFYCLGNHDPKNSKIRRFKLGDNVCIFDDETPKSIEVKDESGNIIGVVTGVGYSTKHVDCNLTKNFTVPKVNNDIPVAAMLHTSLDVGGDKKYAPCTYSDLSEFGFDYWALGHIHKSAIYGQNKPAVFPGCTCGRDFGETGKKGAFLVTINKAGASKYQFVELAGITWHDEVVSGFEDAADANDMYEVCAKKIDDVAEDGKINFIRLTLSGQCPMYNHVDDEALSDLQDSLEIRTGAKITLRNNLKSLLNPDDYINDKHLLSEALNMARNARDDDDLKNEIIKIVEEQYKGLDGQNSKEYVDSLFENIENKLCDVMIKQED